MKKKKSNKRAPKANGDRKITVAPTAVGIYTRASVPNLSVSNPGAIRIHRREFVTSLTNGANTGFYLHPLSSSVPGLDLNPGVPAMFPWLSSVAPSFERFRFRDLKFSMIPSQSTATAGRYYMAVDYDYDDVVPGDKVAIMGNRTAAEATVWQELAMQCVPAELHRDVPVKYVAGGSRNNYIEPRTSFCGFLIVAFDTTVSNLLFDLWVEYDVELISPVSDGGVIQDALANATAAPAVANVATPIGAINIGFPAIVATAVPGPVKVVTPGAPNVPVLSVSAGGSTVAAPAALDVGTLRSGKLDLRATVTVTGVTPATITGPTTSLFIGADVFDSAGTRLGVAGDPVLPGGDSFNRVTGTKDGTTFTTASAPVQSLGSLFMDALYSLYPTVRYIVPYITTLAALGAGTSKLGYRVEL